MTFGHEGGHAFNEDQRADPNCGRPTCGKCGKVMTRENARLRPELFLHDACLPDGLKPAAMPVDVIPAPTAADLALDVRSEYDTVQFAETHGDRLGNSAAYLRRLAAAEADRDRLKPLLAELKAAYEHRLGVLRRGRTDLLSENGRHGSSPWAEFLEAVAAFLAAADPNRRA